MPRHIDKELFTLGQEANIDAEVSVLTMRFDACFKLRILAVICKNE